MGGLILLAIIVVAALWAVSMFNGLVRRKNVVAEAWSGIEAQLKRRADLIPNLVETVKGYAGHERETFDELARLRAAGQAQGDVAQRAQTETAITAAIGRVLAVAEAYPELKASENFQSLQKELADIEDQIQLARRYYNGAVRDFNVMIEQFPSNIVANLGAFKPAPFFEIENAADRDPPKVTFAG
ncbi:MAG TPA: LemA family protein [Rhizomicrobium sp.]|jgi:LemA protein